MNEAKGVPFFVVWAEGSDPIAINWFLVLVQLPLHKILFDLNSCFYLSILSRH